MSEQVIKNPMQTPSPISSPDLGEQLSALMDGELSRDQVRFLLRSVEAESDFARRWSSYHVISATLRREFVALPLRGDFSASLLAKLDTESGVASTPRAYTALRWLGGGAIAAAVAVVALVVSRPTAEHAGNAAAPMLAHQPVPAAVAPAPQPDPYLPLAPGNPFNPNNVMPASLDSVLPNLYAPNGQLVSRNYLGDGAAPYVIYPMPVYRQATPMFGPMRPSQPTSVSAQP